MTLTIQVQIEEERTLTLPISAKVDLKLYWCPPGSFVMGSGLHRGAQLWQQPVEATVPP